MEIAEEEDGEGGADEVGEDGEDFFALVKGGQPRFECELTALRQHHLLNLGIGETDGMGDADVPIRLEGSTDSQEEEHGNGGEKSGESDQAVQGQSDLSRVHDAQQKEADGDLGQG